MKRIISIAFVLLFIVSTADAYVTVDNIYYNIANGEASVTYGERYNYNSSRYTGDISIPESISVGDDTYPVTSIGSYAFYECDQLTSVSLPSSIKNIQDYAFSWCKALTGIKIPNSVSSIGKYAFQECRGIVSLGIPKSVVSIGQSAFYACTGLIELSIDPHPNLTIGANAFYYCGNLKYIKIPDIASWCGITFEPDSNSHEPSGKVYSNPCAGSGTLYMGAKKITSVEIPGNVTTIKDCTFAGCEITSVTLHSSVTSIGDYAFCKCYSLKEVTIPNSVISIGEGVFHSCRYLSSLDFWPESVTFIPNYTFSCCLNLENLNIPEGVTGVGSEAFSYCSGMTELTVPKTLTSFGIDVFRGCNKLSKVTWNARYCNNFNSGNLLFNETFKENSIEGKLSSFTFGEEVSKIPAYLCYWITIPSLQIPNSVKTIGNYAFCGSHLNELTLGNSVESIEYSAFQYNDIEALIVPNSATYIGQYAFDECKNLKKVSLGASVRIIGDNAFYKCSDITSINFPASLTKIGDRAFYNCKGITSIDLPSSLTQIGQSAFSLTGLKSITIPNSVTSIGQWAFYGCSDIASIEMGNSIESIGSEAFTGCNLISHITIPASVKTMGLKPFPESVTTVKWNAKNCADYSSSTLKISPYFGNCSLSSIKFGKGVERIPAYICQQQPGLTEITFPASVKVIGANPLKSCTGLQKITSHIIEPMTVALGLTDEQYEQLPLYIPKGTTDAYLNALGWADFLNMIEMTGEGKGDLNGDGSVDGGDVSILLEMVLAGGLTDEQKAVADLNGDGDVDGGDVSILLEMVLSGE